MEHPRNVEGYADFDGVVDKIIGNNHTGSFLEELAADLCFQGDKDFSNGRKKLADRLYNAGERLYTAARLIEQGRESSDIAGLAQNVGRMQYDCTAKVIGKLSQKVAGQGVSTLESDREKGENLVDAAENLNYACNEMMAAWKICKQYMTDRTY